MLDIAMRPPTTRIIVSDVARRQHIPALYLAKIVPRLARAGLLHTSLGVAGGIKLATPAEQISVLQIIEAVDGPLALNLCSSNPTNCGHHTTCPACETWCQAQSQLNQTLAQTRLSDLAARTTSRQTRTRSPRTT